MKPYITGSLAGYDEWKTATPEVEYDEDEDSIEAEDAATWRADAKREEEC